MMEKKRTATYSFVIKPVEFLDYVDLSLLPYEVEKKENGLDVIVDMDEDTPELHRGIKKDLRNTLTFYTFKHQETFTLKYGGAEKVLPNGKICYELIAKGITMSISLGRPEITIVPAGYDIDPELERKEAALKSIELISQHSESDEIAQRLIDHYHLSLEDSDKAIADLYKIREILQKAFKSSKKAQDALKVSKSDWTRFGQLTNAVEIKQSRHASPHFNALRDITGDELWFLRGFAGKMILAYFDFLDEQKTT